MGTDGDGIVTGYVCPVCGGHCSGYQSSDARYAHCTRAEYAGPLRLEADGETFRHTLRSSCPCGGGRHATWVPDPGSPTPLAAAPAAQSPRADAKAFLKDLLAGGEMPAKEVLAGASGWGINIRTLRRAKKDMDIHIGRVGKPGQRGGGRWVWRLPATCGHLNHPETSDGS